MSVPPSDPQNQPGPGPDPWAQSPYYGPPQTPPGYPPAQPYAVPPQYPQQGYGPYTQPTTYPQVYPPTGYPQAYPPNPFPYQPGHPSTPPKKLNTRTILIIVAVVVAIALVTALIVVLVNRNSPSFTNGSINTSSASVVEAIDIPNQPELGTPWNATDGDPGEQLDSQFFVTPCGVLVTMLTSDYSHQGNGANARLVGYDISTGTKAWSTPLQKVSGLNDPAVGYSYSNPTAYTSSCTMVIMLMDMDSSSRTKVGLAVDLSTGQASVIASSEDMLSCSAAGTQVACWDYDNKMTIFDPARGTSKTKMLSDDASAYSRSGGMVVDGRVWSADGYRDPVSDNVVFGSDVSTSRLSQDQDWVVYIEPYKPGGYLSDAAIRVQGPLGAYSGNPTCSIMAWDTDADKGRWDKPASLPCSTYYDWTVAGSALLVSDDLEDKVWAFSMDDGSPLWQKDIRLSHTAWDRANDSLVARGLTDDYAIAVDDSYEQEIVRIADGTTITDPASRGSTMTLSPTMAYANEYVRGGILLSAYSMSGNSGTSVWSVSLPGDVSAYDMWTFATGGTMYVVYSEYDGPTWVAPLIE